MTSPRAVAQNAIRIFFLTCFALLAVVATAAAASPVQNGYSDPGGQIQSDVVGAHTGQLPFTGLDVGMFAVAGIVLLLMGLALRRVATARNIA